MARTATCAFFAALVLVCTALAPVFANGLSEEDVKAYHVRVAGLHQAGKYAEALKAAEEWLKAAEDSESPKPGVETAKALGAVAWQALFAKRPEQALAATQRAMKLAPGTVWIKTNYAHALLFLGRTDEAVAAYGAHKGEVFSGKTKWEAAIRKDIAEFRKHGLGRPEMERVEAALAIPAAEVAAKSPAAVAAAKSPEPAPKPAEATPKAPVSEAKAAEAAPKVPGPAPKAVDAAAKAPEPAPKAAESAPKASGPAPKAAEAAPKAPAPKAEEAAPKTPAPAPGPASAATRALDPAAKASESAPKVPEPAPKVAAPVAKPGGAARDAQTTPPVKVAGACEVPVAGDGPSHIVGVAVIQVHKTPDGDGPVTVELKRNDLVTVKACDGPWALIVRKGAEVGYVRYGGLERVN